ncbi:MAG: XdhC/CoxI family protein [Deltaproteobacteria bacterium]|nr:XdhC/CoxI family protein [Deltaproteobacteria bacterium]
MNMTTKLCACLAQQKIFCLATIIASGDPRLPVGRKAIVWPDGRMEESFGVLPVDKTLRDLAVKALANRECATIEMTDTVSVFLDILAPDAKLLICGAGHIAMPLARFSREVGFSVTVLDDREDFAHPSRFPGCTVIAEDYAPALRKMALGPATYTVVITRGHEHDLDCLLEILPKETAYVGLIGSRRRIGFVLEELVQRGIARERCAELFTPIGLPIGAESPEEIALAIAAELVSVRRRRAQKTRALRTAPGVA